MFNNLANTQMADIAEDDLLIAMGGEAKEKAPEEKEEPEKKIIEKKTPAKQSKTSTVKSDTAPKFGPLADIVDADLEAAMTGQVKKEPETEIEEEEEEEEVKELPDEQEEEEKQDDDEVTSEIEIHDFLKARVELLIAKGEWMDFEGREDAEWTEEDFEEMELKQRDYQREVMREELLDSFGPYGKEIAAYAANGGDPDKLIDLFKEDQRIETLSIDTQESQMAVVFKYETEVRGRSADRANKIIQTLIADKELEAEAKEAKSLMQKEIDVKIASLQNQQAGIKAAQAKQQADSLREFSNNVVTVINGNADMSPEEKKELVNVLTKFDKKLKNGAPVNDFYFKFAEFKKDLPNYINLVRFVMNPKKFTDALITKGNNTAVDKAFKIARTSGEIKKAKTSTPSGNGTSKPKTTFKLM